MSGPRLLQVLAQEFRFNVRRPLFWIALLLLLFFSWAFSVGGMTISSGESTVGGQRAWVTSEFALAQILSVILGIFYIFFLAVAAGMSVIKDEEWRVMEMLRATPLRPGEYVWGKFLGVFLSFIIVLSVFLTGLAFFNHVLPNAEMAEYRGPFALVNYLRPALILGLPPALFIAGTSFALGALTRRGILVFLFPVAFLLGCAYFLWSWSPTWLNLEVNRLLMLVDPTGFRWLMETYLEVDRGVQFYNLEPVVYDGGFLASRLVFLALGVGVIGLVPRRVGGRYRMEGKERGEPGLPWVGGEDEEDGVRRSLASVDTVSLRPGIWMGFSRVLRSEFRELIHAPGLYLFTPLILLTVVGTASVAVGAFNTPVLLTPGTMAVTQAEMLNVFLCLLLLFYAVETLERDRATGLAAISYPTPVGTRTVLLAKATALMGVVGVILSAAFVGDASVLLFQGTVPVSVGPFVQVWGLLVIPTCLGWIAFLMAVMGLTRSRWATYGVGFGVLSYTIYLEIIGEMSWLTNWWVQETVPWTDMGFLELNGRGLLLNRLFVLSLGLLFFVLALKWFNRKDRDPVGLLSRLRPKPLLVQMLVLSPFLLLPLVSGVTLWVGIHRGFQGDVVEKAAKDYWRKNVATWTDVETPAVAAAELDLELEPEQRAFRTEGRYLIFNHLEDAVKRLPFTQGLTWDSLSWTLDREPIEPKNRAGLWVMDLPAPLQPGDSLWVGFRVKGVLPKGITANGGGVGEFILPSSVVLAGGQEVAPQLGYGENIGVDEDNESDAEEYAPDYYLEQVDPAFGSRIPMTTRIRITGPDYLTYTSVGNLVSEQRLDGKVTVVWESDHPVRMFNVVAGKWDVWRGEGTEIYYHPEHGYNIEEMGLALDASRRWYAEWFVPFPWTTLRVNEFMGIADYAQGFPTNITFSESIGFLTKNDLRTLLVFFVTAHEAAHQWWGNMLTPGEGPGGNIISEGMANFSTLLLVEQIKGEAARREFAKRMEEAYARGRRADDERPMVEVDGTHEGDGRVTYEKGGWVPWMLMALMGREAMLEGLREFIVRYRDGPDYPLLQDQVNTLREFAPDTVAFDEFVDQWYFDVLVPEYRVEEAERRQLAGEEGGLDTWETTFTLRNIGAGLMPVAVAVTVGEPFDQEGEALPGYREARTTVTLGAGEERAVTIRSDFEPERIVVDPGVRILQLRRERAVHEF
jgi:ABC-type transport system involved in multi-copper enzyme maturation permease subunit